MDRFRIRVLVNVGPDDIRHQIREAYDPEPLMSAYGITELCGTVVFTALDDPLEARVTTCGPPLPRFELRVVDPGLEPRWDPASEASWSAVASPLFGLLQQPAGNAGGGRRRGLLPHRRPVLDQRGGPGLLSRTSEGHAEGR